MNNVNSSNNAEIRVLSNESNDTISNTKVINEGGVVTVESSVNNTVESNKNHRLNDYIFKITVEGTSKRHN